AGRRQWFGAWLVLREAAGKPAPCHCGKVKGQSLAICCLSGQLAASRLAVAGPGSVLPQSFSVPGRPCAVACVTSARMTLRILLILGALSAFGPLAIDFYLPSFPTLARQFATDVEHVQLSLAAYFAGLAIGQLLYGPLADRFGRRRPLLVGVSLFALASLACAW